MMIPQAIPPYYIALIAACILALVTWLYRRPRYPFPLPPGPPGVPILGNILDLNVPAVWEKYASWAKTYGDIMTVDVLGTPMIVLNSVQATTDLLEKRSANYSDRPDMPMIKDLMGWTWTFALMEYGPSWREHRKVFTQQFMSVKMHRDIQIPVVQDLVHRLARTPNDFIHHLRHYTGAIIMKRVYGHSVAPENDPYVELVDKASESTSLASLPPGFLVDLFPSLKYVPEWFPGAGFKKLAREWRLLSNAMVEEPYNMVKGKVAQGTSVPCFVSTCLEQRHESADAKTTLSEELIKNTAAVAYAAGVDTTASSLTTFIFAMMTHPTFQSRAQAEIDSVIGNEERLPDFGDRERLPLVTAIMKETLRWIPVLPLSVPHRSVKGEQYRSFWIPPGTMIVPNTWAILWDENVFKEPSTYNPNRYIENPNLPDPNQTFGYGRRTCAGKDMAIDTLWLAIATILSVYNISKSRDAHGKEIEPEQKLGPGVLCHLEPFPCTISPRPGKEWVVI